MLPASYCHNILMSKQVQSTIGKKRNLKPIRIGDAFKFILKEIGTEICENPIEIFFFTNLSSSREKDKFQH